MKLAKKILLCALAVLLVSCFAVAVNADADDPAIVTLRIEGINKNLYNAKVELDDKDEITVADVISKADFYSEGIKVTGLEDSYITDINGESAGAFGGMDGWLYRVNGEYPTVAMNEHIVYDGDVIVVYYGDPFGVGMQFPEMDCTELKNGVLKFTSKDTTYDESFNATVKVNPVADMKVTFDGKEYITDAEGVVNIDKSLLTIGSHDVTVSKYAENGLPLVLRLDSKDKAYIDSDVKVEEAAPDYSIWFKVAIGVIIAGLVIYVLVKPKRDY